MTGLRLCILQIYVAAVVTTTQFSIEKTERKVQSPSDPHLHYEEPFSRQRIRLSNYGENTNRPYEGLVEVYRAGRWGIVCDDGWDIDDATVACRQLGYIYGATGALRAGHTFSPGPWNESSFLMDDVSCTGSETALHKCQYVVTHNCKIAEAAAVICKENRGCGDDWLAGPTGCYTMPVRTKKKNLKKVRKSCDKLGGHLAVIETAIENDFLSNALQIKFPDIHDWLVSGEKREEGWIWGKISYERPGMNILRRKHIKQYKTHILKRWRRKRNYYLKWIPMLTTRWFPGWPPSDYREEPDQGTCVKLTNKYHYINGSDVQVSYMFWKATDCVNLNRWNYICEKPIQQDSNRDECFHGNGADYRGTYDHIGNGLSCQEWTESESINPDSHQDKGLGNHSYCRNPDDENQPWCWTNTTLEEFAFCSIQQCQENNTLIYTDEELGDCPPGKFYCYQDRHGRCINAAFRCDNEVDCPNGEDEVSCDYALNHFNKTNNVRIDTPPLAKYGLIPLEMCARFCYSGTDLVCRSFYYRRSDKSCYLTGYVPSLAGNDVLTTDTAYDTYELVPTSN